VVTYPEPDNRCNRDAEPRIWDKQYIHETGPIQGRNKGLAQRSPLSAQSAHKDPARKDSKTGVYIHKALCDPFNNIEAGNTTVV